jgi:hypothetical protein
MWSIAIPKSCWENQFVNCGWRNGWRKRNLQNWPNYIATTSGDQARQKNVGVVTIVNLAYDLSQKLD